MTGKHIYIPVLFFCFSFLVLSCTDTVVSKTVHKIDSNWFSNNPVSFSFEVPDTSKVFDLVLKVIHTTEYDYQNLYTRIKTTFPSGRELEENVSLELANRAGRWNGKCNSKRCNTDILLQGPFKFQEPGVYKIQVEPYMRIDPVTEIERIEISINHSR